MSKNSRKSDNKGRGDGFASRLAALMVFEDVLSGKKQLAHAFEGCGEYMQMGRRDKAFIRMLVCTALRRKGQMEVVLDRAVDGGEKPHPQRLEFLLYIGITQILFMEVPDHAAVDVCVNLAEKFGMVRQKGFVNAVLRRIAREGREWLSGIGSVEHNIPEWIYSQWVADYGREQARHIAEASLYEAPLDITVKEKGREKEWAEKLGAQVLPGKSLRLKSGGGDVTRLCGFDEGEWWVQDISASLPAKVLGDIRGKRVIELCAAPGGKSAQLLAGGAKVVAVDRSAKRMELLKSNLDRLGLAAGDAVSTVVGDASVWRSDKVADIVLLDAPCTATGTIRRNPDILHLKTRLDQEKLVAVQRRLLKNAAGMVKEGGVLLYCTCSLQKEEGEKMVEEFLSDNNGFARKEIKPASVGGIKAIINDKGEVRVLPSHMAVYGGMDGFYICMMKRK